MSPEAVDTTSHSKATDCVGDDAPKDCEELQFEGDLEECEDGQEVKYGQGDGVVHFHWLFYWEEAPHFVHFLRRLGGAVIVIRFGLKSAILFLLKGVVFQFITHIVGQLLCQRWHFTVNGGETGKR